MDQEFVDKALGHPCRPYSSERWTKVIVTVKFVAPGESAKPIVKRFRFEEFSNEMFQKMRSLFPKRKKKSPPTKRKKKGGAA